MLTRYIPLRVQKGEMLRSRTSRKSWRSRCSASSRIHGGAEGVELRRAGGLDEQVTPARPTAIWSARFLGEDVPHRFIEPPRKSLMGRLFGATT